MVSGCTFSYTTHNRISLPYYTHFLFIWDSYAIIGRYGRQLDLLKKQLRRRFEIPSLGQIRYFLGIKIEKSSTGFYSLSKKAFVKEITKCYELDEAKTSKYPLDVGYIKQTYGDNVQYHRLEGALLYLATNIRADIAAAVSYRSCSSNRHT